MTSLIRILILFIAGYLIFLACVFLLQRKMLYYPTHHGNNNGLSPWILDGNLIGYARETAVPETIWLFLHGNGGQASDRVYALPSFSVHASIFILEYPGYGSRPGSPSMDSINKAATQAYEALRQKFPQVPVCVAGESIGSGPASYLAKNRQPPDKIALILPFDTLADVAAVHYPYLPVKLLMQDNWDNVASLMDYKGPIEIFGARDDTIVPIRLAKNLADSKPAALFHFIDGDHNDWADGLKVKIRYNNW